MSDKEECNIQEKYASLQTEYAIQRSEIQKLEIENSRLSSREEMLLRIIENLSKR